MPKAHRDRYAIETPAGLVWIKNNFKEDYVYSTTVRNVNSYVIENELRIDVDDVKDVPVNLAYGGNVFAIVPAARFGIKIQPSYMERIKHYSARIREVIAEKGIAVTLVQWYDEPKSKEADPAGGPQLRVWLSGSLPRRHRHQRQGGVAVRQRETGHR